MYLIKEDDTYAQVSIGDLLKIKIKNNIFWIILIGIENTIVKNEKYEDTSDYYPTESDTEVIDTQKNKQQFRHEYVFDIVQLCNSNNNENQKTLSLPFQMKTNEFIIMDVITIYNIDQLFTKFSIVQNFIKNTKEEYEDINTYQKIVYHLKQTYKALSPFSEELIPVNQTIWIDKTNFNNIGCTAFGTYT